MMLSIAISVVAAASLVLARLARLPSPRDTSRRVHATAPAGARDLGQIGVYTIEGELGAGAMGAVYRARNGADGSALALKLLPRGASRRERQRFDREARFGAALHHPNVAAVHGSGEHADGTRYIAMDLVEGETLQALVERRGPLPLARVIRIARELCAALSHLHERGLVHRDIKPENVLVTGGARGRVKLIDFGLTEPVGAVLEPDVIAGTPLYISPEALTEPGSVDARSDLYALGALMYFMLCGAPVFGGQTVLEVCAHHLHTVPERLGSASGRAIPPALERIVMDCLAKQPAARPASAAVVAERLSTCLGPRRRAIALGPRRRPRVRCLPGDSSMTCLAPLASVPVSWGLVPSVMQPPTPQVAACCSVRS
jgi:serine/threonine-protein kinase